MIFDERKKSIIDFCFFAVDDAIVDLEDETILAFFAVAGSSSSVSSVVGSSSSLSLSLPL